METICTVLAEEKEGLSRLKETFSVLGFLVQENLLGLFKNETEPPVKIYDRPDIILLFHKDLKSKAILKKYITTHKNPERIFVFYETEDKEAEELCVNIRHSSFSKKDLESDNKDVSDNTIKEIFEKLFNWLKDVPPLKSSTNPSYYLKEEHIADLKICLSNLLNKNSAIEYNAALSNNPYYHYYFFRKRYDKLSSIEDRDDCKKETTHLLSDISKKLKEYKNFTGFYTLMGWIYQYNLYDYEKAADYFKEAYDLNPKNAFSAYYVAISLQKTASLFTIKNAIDYYNFAVENNAACYQAYFKIARIYDDLEFFDSALEEYKKIDDILAYTRETIGLNENETNYYWKYNYFSMNIYSQRGLYASALANLDQLIIMRKNGIYLNEDDKNRTYYRATIDFLEDKKRYFEARIAALKRENKTRWSSPQLFFS